DSTATNRRGEASVRSRWTAVTGLLRLSDGGSYVRLPDMDRPNLDAQLDRAASLGDPVRRALYRFVVASSGPISRDEAAAGVGVERHVAKFHLDRLARDGLLTFDYQRPAGRGGPGAGRPTKRYHQADAQLDVSLPERRYQLAGELLVEAIAAA